MLVPMDRGAEYGLCDFLKQHFYRLCIFLCFIVADSDGVSVPTEFPFPFTPYDIQVGFMKDLYKALELGKIGIFESPTGTVSSRYDCLLIVC